MKRFVLAAILLLLVPIQLYAQFFRKVLESGIYFQWGYNRDFYTKSDMHFSNGDKYNFTLYGVRATDKPDYEAFYKNPIDITIPQNSCRLGFYLDSKREHAIEVNFDHAKYVMIDGQRLRMSGIINETPFLFDTVVSRNFIHVEHTNGANFLMLNYFGQTPLIERKRSQLNLTWRVGGGVVVPRSDIILMGKRLDNKYHVAGYIGAGEVGTRYYFFKGLFLEASAKVGYANYLDALAMEGGKISHSFFFTEFIGLLGYELALKRKEAKVETQ
ncbi:hypothetical protein [Polluticoccus soli]|uniref:hypothetical protein n=1 Tax=Polluticoccus soli TaxID=3034150 RepID=UPI0023E1E0E7|nr:hypothetical protein [Flavipsychrobacter sp. JY13-12]